MYRVRDLQKLCAALADRNRLRLLHAMSRGEICVCHLQGILRANQPRTSRHLAYLKGAGLVEARRDGRWMYYRLKKLDRITGGILEAVFKALRDDVQIKGDLGRLNRICCNITPPRRRG